MTDYSWAATYSAGSDAMVYRRFKGVLPSIAERYAATRQPPSSPSASNTITTSRSTTNCGAS